MDCHVNERENTLASFREAGELGVDGVELDVRRTQMALSSCITTPGSNPWRSLEDPFGSARTTSRHSLRHWKCSKGVRQRGDQELPEEPGYDEAGTWRATSSVSRDDGGNGRDHLVFRSRDVRAVRSQANRQSRVALLGRRSATL